MRLSDLLRAETITVTLGQRSKQGVIEELLDLMMGTGKISNRSKDLKAVLEREALMSTGLEKGVAVPHAKTAVATELVMSLGISKEGVEFEAADRKPSHLFFFLLAPEAAAGPNVQVLGQIARLTSDTRFCETLQNASSADEALKIIRDAE